MLRGALFVVLTVGAVLVSAVPFRERGAAVVPRSSLNNPNENLLIQRQDNQIPVIDPPKNSQLYSIEIEVPGQVRRTILEELPDNATLIRPNIVDTFSCDGLGYGYYADVENDCQLFHVCLPWHELYPDQIKQEVTYKYSFICNSYQQFSQETMTCAWENEAIPCDLSKDLYWINRNFFRKVPDGKGGERYAYVPEPFGRRLR